MCGIYGIVTERAEDVEADGRLTAWLAHMARAVAHRGPDGAGELVASGCALGHRRLAILDLGPTGRQPLSSPDGRLHAAVNGEIYNHEHLVRDPAAAGSVPPGRGDARAALAAYARHDADFPRALDGMFAAAVWDEPRRRLVLARDRLGQKPLFYRPLDGGLAFASTLPALVEPGRTAGLDRRALASYLMHHAVPPPATMIEGVRALRAGHRLVVERGRTREERWTEDPAGPDTPWAEAFERAVERRLMSDVPVGVLLSGGLDSSAVLSVMHEQAGGGIPTFTMGFDDPAHDERPLAEAVARCFRTDHHEVTLSPPTLDAVAGMVRRFGEPFADSSALALVELSGAVARQVKVALTGDGGDELLGGYDRYRAVVIAGRGPGRALLAALGASRRGRRAAKLAALGASRGLGPAARLLATQATAGSVRLADLLGEAWTEAIREERRRYRKIFDHAAGRTVGQRLLHLDRATNLETDLLVKTDRASMAWGLELRSPFLDTGLAAAVAARMRCDASFPRPRKVELRRWLRGRIPEPVRRGAKRGFGIPLERWMARGRLGEEVGDLLRSQAFRQRGLFRPEAIELLLQDLPGRRHLAAELLYAIAVLELWMAELGVEAPVVSRS